MFILNIQYYFMFFFFLFFIYVLLMMLFNTSYYIFSGDNRLDRSEMQQLLGKLHVREEILKLLMFYFLYSQ